MPIIVRARQCISIDSLGAAGNNGYFCFTQFDQVSIDRRRIPVSFTQLFQDFGVRQRCLGSRQNPQDSKTRCSDPEFTVVEQVPSVFFCQLHCGSPCITSKK